jgi:diguanylate cyclase (GGDEF)-like protein
MIQRPVRWLDDRIGINAKSEPERALLRERFAVLKRQLPWLYGILCANLLGLHLTLNRAMTISDLPAGIILTATAFRTFHWLRISATDMTVEEMRRELRSSFILGFLFNIAGLAWCVSLYLGMLSSHRIDVMMFAGLAALGCCHGMSSFPAAARVPMLILAMPISILLLMTASEAVHVGMGASLLMLSGLTLRLLRLHDEVFRGLVSSRLTIQIEQRRAIQAERIAVEEQSRVRVIANTDVLTGLANRRGFLAELDQLHDAKPNTVTLILLDLDGFKPINDTFGHATGDAVLVEVSRRLRSFEGSGASVARLGGDEFALMCRCDSEDDALALAQRTVECLATPWIFGGRQMAISACAGVAWEAGSAMSEAIRRADMALYRAKESGRGSVASFSHQMEQEAQRRTTIEQALRESNLADNIELAFQPIFHLDSLELRSFEALARWRHSELGWISPAEFIPITEQMSVIDDLSTALLQRAAEAALGWPDSVRLSFNLSAVQLCSPETAAKVLATIAMSGLDPRRLQIEVTETALLADFEQARSTLSLLRREGVRIVLDDFGAGYSSIRYMREMNFDMIKLDGSLISSITSVGSGLPLLRGVLALCQAMGQQCVAEHIESDSQLTLLRQLGCRYGQGFWLAAPMDSVAAATLAKAKVLTFPALRARAG